MGEVRLPGGGVRTVYTASDGSHNPSGGHYSLYDKIPSRRVGDLLRDIQVLTGENFADSKASFSSIPCCPYKS